MEHTRRQFGEAIVPILVVIEGLFSLQPLMQVLLDAGFFVLCLEKSTLSTSSASRCARDIQTFLMHRPYRFEGIEFDDAKGIAASSAKGAAPIKGKSQSPVAFQQFEKTQERSRASSTVVFSLPVPGLETTDPSSHSMASVAPRARIERSPALDMFFDVLVSLKSVLNPVQFEVLERELSAFSEEYLHEHYTACGLRIGRTLEHVVYALACAWGVRVNRAALQVLSDLENSFEQLSRAVVDYATTDEDEKVGRKKSVQRQYEIVISKLTKLIFDLDSDKLPKSTDVPVNVESIVRDIRKQFGRRNKVLNSVNVIINDNLLRRILDVRNEAAHASTSGERRELSKDEIDAAVELLRTALFLFGNVAFAVAEKEE
jgi:hypothetical protein